MDAVHFRYVAVADGAIDSNEEKDDGFVRGKFGGRVDRAVSVAELELRRAGSEKKREQELTRHAFDLFSHAGAGRTGRLS
jgi:hypothetical protein